MKKKYTAVSKSEIEVHKGKWTCYVTGPSRVCDQLLSLGAKRTNRSENGVGQTVWSFPIDRLGEVQRWHDSLPDVISEFTANIKKKFFEQMVEYLSEGDIVTIDYGEDFIRGFEVVKLSDKKRTVREVEVVNGEPQPGLWKFIEYTISPEDKFIDNRPVSLFRK